MCAASGPGATAEQRRRRKLDKDAQKKETSMSPATFQVEEATIGSIHAAMRNGELTARELVDAYLARIEKLDATGPKLNSVVNVSEHARDRAGELDEALARTGELTGPLHGIPVLVKDCVETSDIPTTFGSEVVSDYLPSEDAV